VKSGKGREGKTDAERHFGGSDGHKGFSGKRRFRGRSAGHNPDPPGTGGAGRLAPMEAASLRPRRDPAVPPRRSMFTRRREAAKRGLGTPYRYSVNKSEDLWEGSKGRGCPSPFPDRRRAKKVESIGQQHGHFSDTLLPVAVRIWVPFSRGIEAKVSTATGQHRERPCILSNRCHRRLARYDLQPEPANPKRTIHESD
jgi:hypothetical protein